MHSVLHGGLCNDTQLDDKSFELLIEIQQELSVFEPVDDDNARIIWLEIPRGTAKEMRAWDYFRYEREDDEDDEDDDLQSYQEALDEDYPMQTEWYFLTTSTYKENHFLKISDRCHQYIIMTNRDSMSNYRQDMSWFLVPLLELVKERVAEIVKDPEAYNRHLESDLPYCQRSGRIRSRDLNAILPRRRIAVQNREYCIAAMEELIRREEFYEHTPKNSHADYWKENNLPVPFGEMTIRKFCHYYRIADTVFRNDYNLLGDRDTDSAEDDVEYYKNSGIHYGKIDDYDLDSVADFKSFANDHYGELGLSRMNVGSSDYYADGKWLVTFGISYSVCLEIGLKIALALYETGAPFIYYDAENTLHMLEETGWVRIEPRTFHDYLGSGDDEGVISLPFEEECGTEGEISLEQFRQVVERAIWQKQEWVKLEAKIGYDDPVALLVRDRIEFPTTLGEIRQAIETEYKTYLSVLNDSEDGRFCYVVPDDEGKCMSFRKSELRYGTFNEAMYALIMNFNDIIKGKSAKMTPFKLL